MDIRLVACLIIGLGLGATTNLGAADSPSNNTETAQAVVGFSETASYSTPEEIARRFGFVQPAPSYEIGREKFKLLLPNDYTTNGGWGALVWISPGEDAYVRKDWVSELAKHRLLFLGAYNGGNNRNPIDRIRLALDAASNVSRHFGADRKRIYVGGLSGGGRIASMLGIAYGDVFTGALCICGVNFYKNVPTTGGKFYPATYVPPQESVVQARKNRFVLLTGEEDMNRQATKDTWIAGFRANGFQNVLCLDVKGMKHELPGAPVLNTALNYLDGVASSTNKPRS